jgi:Leucine-rich repeat (LRR) protein
MITHIVDVSALPLPDGLTELRLDANLIVDVSALTLPDGLTELYLGGTQIVDGSALTLPAYTRAYTARQLCRAGRM